tara:strand:+ start:272 stop:508 length:237 start_codon:yes stop_codon:yes gene_type:complete
MKKLISIFLVLIISLFSESQFVISLEENADSSEKVKIEKINDNNINDDSLKSTSITDDIFGDEQTFPFVAGLGKNAAH